MKTLFFAKICYILGLHKLAYYLNRNRKRVITFHNVLDDALFTQNIANGVSNSFSDFKKIIDEVSSVFPFSLDLDNAKTVTITFDDGYQNQLEIAASYLISKGIPAYIFVAGELLEDFKDGSESKSLIIDKLTHWISYVPAGNYILDIEGTQTPIKVTDSSRQEIWSSIIWPAFQRDNISKGESVFRSLDRAFPYSTIVKRLSKEYIKQRLTGFTLDRLDALKAHGWRVGWHTSSHYPVSKLIEADKQEELKPKDFCNSTVFSFPYGGPDDSDNQSIEILKGFGYTAAMSNVNFGNAPYGKWFRSRMSLLPEPVLLHFELSGLKYLLKYHKLLPKL